MQHAQVQPCEERRLTPSRERAPASRVTPPVSNVINHRQILMKFDVHDPCGFLWHCSVASLILLNLEVNAHTKHHVRGCVREASLKVTKQPGKGKEKAEWVSKSALSQLEAGNKDQLVLEHAVPVSYINDLVLKLNNKSPENIAEVIYKWTVLCVITVEEHNNLLKNGLGKAMPKNWNESESDKFARYKFKEADIGEPVNRSYNSFNRTVSPLAFTLSNAAG